MGIDRNRKGYYGAIRGRKESMREMRDLNARMSDEVKQIVKDLNTLPYTFRHTIRRKVLIHAAQPIVDAAKRFAPVEKKGRTITIWAVDRKTGKKTHPVKYLPGNLRKSIRVLEFKRSNDIFVGPKVVKKASASAYGRSDRNVNAFYAHWVEYGSSTQDKQPYMRPALDMAGGEALRRAREKLAGEIMRWAKQLQKEGYRSPKRTG